MLNIVLFEPEIPENTGNIARTCIGFNATLHMIRPYGFIFSNKKMKRAGLDYWNKLNLFQYDCWDDFKIINNIQNELNNLYLITKFGNKSIADLKKADLINNEKTFFVFGKETKGLPDNVMQEFRTNQLKINMNPNIRSFNVSNTVAIICYAYHSILNFKNI